MFAADWVSPGFAELMLVLLVAGGAQPISRVELSILAPHNGPPGFFKPHAPEFHQHHSMWSLQGCKRNFPRDKYPCQDCLAA